MDIIADVTTVLAGAPTPVSRLHGDAWAVWNQSYNAEDRDTYRAVGRELYQEAVHEGIAALFARSDEQNQRLDALLQNVLDRAA